MLTLFTQLGLTQSAIVLINEQPTRVKLEDGEITTVYEKVPNHMDGFAKAPEDAFSKLELSQFNADVPAVADNDTTESDTEDIQILDDSHLEVANIDESVNFDYDSAILTPGALTTIKSYASVIKSNDKYTVMLKSWYKSGDQRSQELVKNRLDACKAYLEANGVPSNIIVTSMIGSNRESKFVSVILN